MSERPNEFSMAASDRSMSNLPARVDEAQAIGSLEGPDVRRFEEDEASLPPRHHPDRAGMRGLLPDGEPAQALLHSILAERLRR